MNTEYRVVKTLAEIQAYIGDHKIVSFDYETAPDLDYRNEDRAALDPAKSHICTMSLSVEPFTGIMVPVQHLVGENMPRDEFYSFLRRFLTDSSITKIAHNLAFEAMFSYKQGIVVQPPVYDTIAASQLTLKAPMEFRTLSDSGLKTLALNLCHEPLPSFTAVTAGRHFDELDPSDPETIRYSCADSDFALRLYHRFNEWFDRYLPRHRWIVENLESPTAVFVGIMKCSGIPVDIPAMQAAKTNADSNIDRLRAEIAEMIGSVEIAKIRNYLKTVPNCFFWKEHGGQYGTAGIPDIIACIEGHFFGFEVKTDKGKPTALQTVTIRKILAAGGTAAVVRSVDEVRALIEGALQR